LKENTENEYFSPVFVSVKYSIRLLGEAADIEHICFGKRTGDMAARPEWN
jgi:hypothetical protein